MAAPATQAEVPMDAETVIRGVYADFARGDAEAVLAAFDPRIEFHLAEHHLYWPGPEGWTGPVAVAENFFARIEPDWRSFTVHPRVWHRAGETVVVQGRYTGVNRATGRPLDMQFCHVWQVRDGRVERFQQYTDTAHLRDVATGASCGPLPGRLRDDRSGDRRV